MPKRSKSQLWLRLTAAARLHAISDMLGHEELWDSVPGQGMQWYDIDSISFPWNTQGSVAMVNQMQSHVKIEKGILGQ